MTKFADQLFDDLMRDHGAALAATGRPAPKRRLVTRPLLLTAGAAGLAVATAGGYLVVGGGTPAYAVTPHSDGTVSLAVYQQSGIAQANAKLRTLGDKQVVLVPVKAGCPSIDSLPQPAGTSRPGAHVSIQSTTAVDSGTVTVNAHGVPKGDTLVVAFENTTTTGGDHAGLGAARLTSGAVPSCVTIPASAPAGSVSGSHSGTGPVTQTEG